MAINTYLYLESSEKRWYKVIVIFNLAFPLLIAVVFIQYRQWRLAAFIVLCQVVLFTIGYGFRQITKNYFKGIEDELPAGLYLSKSEFITAPPVEKIPIESIIAFDYIHFIGLAFLKVSHYNSKNKIKKKYFFLNELHASYLKALYQDTPLKRFVNQSTFAKIQSKIPPTSLQKYTEFNEEKTPTIKFITYFALVGLIAFILQLTYKKIISHEKLANFLAGVDDVSEQNLYGQYWPTGTTRKITPIKDRDIITMTSEFGLQILYLHLLGKVECDIANNQLSSCKSESGIKSDNFETDGSSFIHFKSIPPYLLINSASTFKGRRYKGSQLFYLAQEGLILARDKKEEK